MQVAVGVRVGVGVGCFFANELGVHTKRVTRMMNTVRCVGCMLEMLLVAGRLVNHQMGKDKKRPPTVGKGARKHGIKSTSGLRPFAVALAGDATCGPWNGFEAFQGNGLITTFTLAVF